MTFQCGQPVRADRITCANAVGPTGGQGEGYGEIGKSPQRCVEAGRCAPRAAWASNIADHATRAPDPSKATCGSTEFGLPLALATLAAVITWNPTKTRSISTMIGVAGGQPPPTATSSRPDVDLLGDLFRQLFGLRAVVRGHGVIECLAEPGSFGRVGVADREEQVLPSGTEGDGVLVERIGGWHRRRARCLAWCSSHAGGRRSRDQGDEQDPSRMLPHLTALRSQDANASW